MSISSTTKERVKWIDSLKGLAIIFVVVGHVLLGYCENNAFPENVNNFLIKVNEWIYSWHMPLFFTISGYTYALAYLYDKVDKKKVKKQIINLIFIYLIFEIVLCFSKVLFSSFVDNKIKITEVVQNIFLPDNLLWYLWVLVVYYWGFDILINRLMVLKNGRLIRIITVILVLLSLAKLFLKDYIEFGLCLGNLVYCCSFFWIGILLRKTDILKHLHKNTIKVCIMVLIIFGGVYYTCVVNENIILGGFASYINAICITLCLFMMFGKIKLDCRLLSKVGKESLVIYLLHTYIVTAIKVLFIRLGLCSTVLCIPIILFTVLVPILFSYFVASLRYKIKFIGIIFNPISIKKNK